MTTRQEQIDAKLHERQVAALERIADHLERIDGYLFRWMDHAVGHEPDAIDRIARAAEHTAGLHLED